MSCDPEWDDEVDVVCTDSGVAGLATAICTVDEDGEVFIADQPPAERPDPTHPRRGWFGPAGDAATDEYFGELTADIDVATLTQLDPTLPVRLAGEPVAPRRRPIPAFEGARLREWAARCIPSPTGYLYTQVTDWTSATVDCGDAELVKIAEIGQMTPDPERPIGSVRDWLTEEALDRDVSAYPVTRFDGLVFEEGVVVGAVFSTQHGPMTIRARHGVLICRNESDADDPLAGYLPADTLRVALVGKEASRFGRVELLTSDPGVVEITRHSQRRASAITPSKS